MIKIIKWSEVFETCDTRKRQRLGWFQCQSGCESRGFRLLMRDGIDGLAALGFFQALCQSMATFSIAARRDGFFANSDGSPMELEDILELSRLGGRPPAEYRQIIGRLVKVGWIEVHNSLEFQQFADYLPTTCRLSADSLPALCKEKEKDKEKHPLTPKGEFAFDEEMKKTETIYPTGTKPLRSSAKNIRVMKNTPLLERVGKWFDRKAGTLATVKEAQMLEAINPSEAQIEGLERFYTAESTLENPVYGRKNSLMTLLNNWDEALDRARGFDRANP